MWALRALVIRPRRGGTLVKSVAWLERMWEAGPIRLPGKAGDGPKVSLGIGIF